MRFLTFRVRPVVYKNGILRFVVRLSGLADLVKNGIIVCTKHKNSRNGKLEEKKLNCIFCIIILYVCVTACCRTRNTHNARAKVNSRRGIWAACCNFPLWKFSRGEFYFHRAAAVNKSKRLTHVVRGNRRRRRCRR